MGVFNITLTSFMKDFDIACCFTLSSLFFLVTLFTFLCHVIHLRFFHPLARFPGPPFAFLTNGFWFYTLLGGRGPQKNAEWHQKWGPIVRIAPNHLSFSTHTAQKAIYGFGTRTTPSLAKDPIFFTPEVDHSMNIINETDRKEHSRMRRMLSFAFSNGNLLENEEVLIRRVDQFIDKIGTISLVDGKERRKGFDIVKEFNYVTFDIMGEISFGDSFEARLAVQAEYHYHWADVIVNTTYMNDVMRAICVIPGLFSVLKWRKTDHMKKTLYQHAAYATEHTEARLKNPTTRKDLTHHILASQGPRPSNLEIASHFNVIMMAGAVTTATFLSAVIYYLGTNKPALQTLQQELRLRFRQSEDITSKALMDCKYLNAVVEEGLRIFPPAGAGHLSRVVSEGGMEIEGVLIPGGTRVSVHQWSVVRNASNFYSPGTFVPERWLEKENEGKIGHRLETSLPFSYGPRGCLGKGLAYLEMRLVLAKLFHTYDLTWINSDEVDWDRDCKGYTLWEKPELRVVLEKRSQ